MECRVCGYSGPAENLEVVTEVRVEVRPCWEDDREYHEAEVEHHDVMLAVCPSCRIVYFPSPV